IILEGEDCGGEGKKVHKRRDSRMYKKINGGKLPEDFEALFRVADSWLVRQLVFTVPGKDRHLFASSDDLNRLSDVVKRVTKAFFPDSRVLAAVQTIGDKDLCKFHPHLHVLIFERKRPGLKYKITPERLSSVKDLYATGLRRLGCSDVRGPGEAIAGKRVDVHYNYASDGAQVLKKIRYLNRPLGPEHLAAWRQDVDGQAMIDLHVRELKR
ncbi:unnamed protein product, partial [marine sediment metagenome]